MYRKDQEYFLVQHLWAFPVLVFTAPLNQRGRISWNDSMIHHQSGQPITWIHYPQNHYQTYCTCSTSNEVWSSSITPTTAYLKIFIILDIRYSIYYWKPNHRQIKRRNEIGYQITDNMLSLCLTLFQCCTLPSAVHFGWRGPHTALILQYWRQNCHN